MRSFSESAALHSALSNNRTLKECSELRRTCSIHAPGNQLRKTAFRLRQMTAWGSKPPEELS
jgi:hypothetical protein